MTVGLLAVGLSCLVSSVASAGIGDGPLPVLVAGKKTLHIYSVPGVLGGDLGTFFSCTSTDKTGNPPMQVGVEVFAEFGGAAFDDPVATSLSLAPGATVIFGTSGAVDIAIDSDLGVSVFKGSARILATSAKLACTAFVADIGNAPPTSMVYLTIIKKTAQKGE